jgi:hypothetical protein
VQEINALEGEKTLNPSLPLKLHRLRSNRVCMGTWLATSRTSLNKGERKKKKAVIDEN